MHSPLASSTPRPCAQHPCHAPRAPLLRLLPRTRWAPGPRAHAPCACKPARPAACRARPRPSRAPACTLRAHPCAPRAPRAPVPCPRLLRAAQLPTCAPAVHTARAPACAQRPRPRLPACHLSSRAPAPVPCRAPCAQPSQC